MNSELMQIFADDQKRLKQQSRELGAALYYVEALLSVIKKKEELISAEIIIQGAEEFLRKHQ